MPAPIHSAPTNTTWPSLPFAGWQDTYATLHMWTQIIGKIRLALAPKLNHWWHSTLYVTPRGLTTSPDRIARTGALQVESAAATNT